MGGRSGRIMYDNVDNAGGDDDDDHNVADNGVEDDYVEDDEVQEDDVEDDHVQGGCWDEDVYAEDETKDETVWTMMLRRRKMMMRLYC